jgi:LuxR family maltose regulon positive regulatory protein
MSGTSPGALDARPVAQGRSIQRSRLATRVKAAIDAGSVILTAGGGCGKTTVLDQALTDTPAVAWITCSPADRAPGTLLLRIVEAIAAAAPGASDALAERLGVGIERVDALAATRELIAELSRLLIEPLVLVFDDAEQLDDAGESLRLIDELLRAEFPLLHVAVASRRPLDLRVAKPRAAGRLVELTAADLTFDPEECGVLLREWSDQEPTPERIDEVMSATEGWPLGVALAVGMVKRAGGVRGLGSAPDLRSYLSEELFDSLAPELSEAAVRSSVVRVITPEVARALELPDDLGDRIERAGILLRRLAQQWVVGEGAPAVETAGAPSPTTHCCASSSSSGCDPSTMRRSGACFTPPWLLRWQRLETGSARSSTGWRRTAGPRPSRPSSRRARDCFGPPRS